MARRKQDSGEDVSLFPFLSVLACVIGTLTMIIAAVAVSALDTEAVDQALEYQDKKSQLSQENEELRLLQEQLEKRRKELEANRSEDQQRIEQLKSRLAKILSQLDSADKQLAAISIEGNKIDLAAQNEEISAMQAELQSRREKIAQLEKEIADRKLPPKESDVTILPGGSGVGFEPTFVECDDGRIVIHEGGKTTAVRTAELNTSAEFARVLEHVKAAEKRTLVFLVRHDGLDTYRQARNFANAKGVKNGKLPVIGDGRIDLSYFKPKKTN